MAFVEQSQPVDRSAALWVVTVYLGSHDPKHVVLGSIGRHARLTQRWRLGGDFELRRYEVRSTLVHTAVRPSIPRAGEAVVAAARSFR